MFLVKWFKGILGVLGLYQKSGDLVFLGLDNAGKTTLLHVLKEDTYTQTDSTIQPHNEELTIGNVRFNTFDLGGHDVARKIWKNYIGAVNGIVFMIDTTDHDRMDLAKLELQKLLETPELSDTPI
jgi:GTP-binding protein SAR1